MSTLPVVVIVGRTNVGKSTLFNRLSSSVKTITLDEEGVTRDFIRDTVTWNGTQFEVIDTGGVSLQKTQDPILQQVRARAFDIIETADILVFVCDGKVGIVPEDREIAKYLRRTGKKVILVVNKSDTSAAQETSIDFYEFGFDPVVLLSAQHGRSVNELLDEIVFALPQQTKTITDKQVQCKVVLLGKPNVGKSSLLNLLLDQDRAIVSDQPGTTREPISEKLTFYQEDIIVTDTAGVRRQRSVTEPLETLMVKSTLQAVENANVVLLMVDSSEGTISDQELKLAFYSFEQKHKALIILFNKQDLVDELDTKGIEDSLEYYEHFSKKVAWLNISCKSKKNIGKILPLIQEIWHNNKQQFDKNEITLLFKKALIERPLYHKTHPLILRSVRQVKSAPITIILIVNEPDWFGPSQRAFFENRLREEYNLKGAPVVFICRKYR